MLALRYNYQMAATPTLRSDQALRLRLRAQGLHPDFAMANPHDLATHLCGLQAQEISAGTHAFQPRSRGITANDVDHARNAARSLVRTWVMRNTLHLIPAEDVRWLLALFSARSIQQTRRRRQQLGLSEPVVERGIHLIRDLLQNGPLTRADLLQRLAQHAIPTSGQAGFHLLARAALEGVICCGPDSGREQTFVLLDHWLAHIQPTRPSNPLATLARRYLTAYAPATPEDLAYWAGITLTDARTGFTELSPETIAVNVEGQDAWILESQAAWLESDPDQEPVVRLLPAFDTYLLGWRDRGAILPAQYAGRIHPGGGILHPSVMLNGQIIGRWKLTKRKSTLTIAVEPFQPLKTATLDLLAAEGQKVGHFLGMAANPVQLQGS